MTFLSHLKITTDKETEKWTTHTLLKLYKIGNYNLLYKESTEILDSFGLCNILVGKMSKEPIKLSQLSGNKNLSNPDKCFEERQRI